MAQWPPEAVNATEALKACVLDNQFEKEMLAAIQRKCYEKKIAEPTAFYEKQLHELKEAIYALQRKLNTNRQNSGISPLQEPFRAKGMATRRKRTVHSQVVRTRTIESQTILIQIRGKIASQ